eukprot:1159651-Pelagomonas_calceolata.AAC.2
MHITHNEGGLFDPVAHHEARSALLPSFGVALTPSTAAGMMAFSSVAVVSNSLLLRARYSVDAQAKPQELQPRAEAQ